MWKQLTDNPHYEVHPDGLIRNKATKRILRPWLVRKGGEQGYLAVTLTLGKRQNVRVHRAVLSAFEAPPSPKHHAAHKNHDSHDNRLANLHWRTHRENHNDSPDRPNTLTDEQAKELWRLRDEEGLGWRRIAARLGLSKWRVHQIIYGGHYRDLRCDKD